MNLVDRLLDHAAGVRWAALPARAQDAALTFVTDSVGVGLAGSRHARLAQVHAAAAAWGEAPRAGAQAGAREWATGRTWPAPTAALLNAWQIHNQEFDCVHERAVVHALATILPALVAEAERQAAREISPEPAPGRAAGPAHGAAAAPPGGAALLEALVVAVDTAATLGCAQAAPMRFFRPAMCGALGATLGLAKLAGLTREQSAQALGIAYSQLAGTMQAHVEGSPMLAMQVGLAARAAVTALDLARAGFSGPRDVLEGPFGYFELFDAPLAPRRAEVEAEFAQLGRTWRIAEVSHKPFPTGRAAHGALDGLARLLHPAAELGAAPTHITPAHIARIELAAPPLILRLVGRPWREGMDVNYARLCLPYLAATLVHQGSVTLDDFGAQALADPARRALAERVVWRPNAMADPNAMAPQTLTVTLSDGRALSAELPAVLGHPQHPLPPAAQRAKFNHCCAHAGLTPAATERLHTLCRTLHTQASLRPWLDAMNTSPPPLP